MSDVRFDLSWGNSTLPGNVFCLPDGNLEFSSGVDLLEGDFNALGGGPKFLDVKLGFRDGGLGLLADGLSLRRDKLVVSERGIDCSDGKLMISNDGLSFPGNGLELLLGGLSP